MTWLWLVAHFFGGAFLLNAVPHLVAGVMGQRFQTPFAKPPGEGYSSSTVNFVWGFGNLIVAHLLLCQVGAFDWRNPADAASLGLGMAAIGLFAARHFGRFNGGNTA